MLQLSHAIGDSVFKKVFRTNSGKGISITSDDDDIGYSSDSWAEHQLCSDCETLLNLRYEKYSMGVLRGKNCTFNKTDFGLSISSLDQHKLIMYFLSIYWRAANSEHPSYKNTVIHEQDNEYLRDAIFNDLKIPSGKFSIRISKVIDLSEGKGFTPEEIKELILSPYCRSHQERKMTNVSVCFMFEGFFIEIYLRPLKIKERNKPGVLTKTKSNLMVPYLNLFEIKEVVDLLVFGYGKFIEGRSRVKL